MDTIEQIASDPENADRSLMKSLPDEIAKDPATVSTAIIKRLGDNDLGDNQVAVYVWALGFTEDEGASDTIIDMHKRGGSPLVQFNCMRSLSKTGGVNAETYMLSVLDGTQDEQARYNILNLLCNMQCEKALPYTEEVLARDPWQFYWQEYFIFGKMGDKAVPFLIDKLDSDDSNVRINAVNLLGTWLAAPEATDALHDLYKAEKDPEMRNIILASMFSSFYDFEMIEGLLDQVEQNEDDRKILSNVRDARGQVEEMRSKVREFSENRNPSAEKFAEEYDSLFKSYGKEGDFDALGRSSTITDEPKLKALRERILQRDSDESFVDYSNVSDIIMMNRLAATE